MKYLHVTELSLGKWANDIFSTDFRKFLIRVFLPQNVKCTKQKMSDTMIQFQIAIKEF